jgi:sugar O-acyltransferase (sialic acid O-acetyltransferase NeuD family)
VIESTDQYQIIGILDLPDKIGQSILGYSVIGTDGDILRFIRKCPNFMITVGQISSHLVREKIYDQVKNSGGVLPVISSPFAYISKYSQIGEGTIIMHHALINANSIIGKACIVNSRSLIEHETTVGDFCHISTSAAINGQVTIGDRCFIGSNSVVANNISVARGSIIAAGSQVLKNIEASGVYIGQPLRRIR